MSFTAVKATFNGETRRFKLSSDQPSASELAKELNRVFGKDPATVLTLQYKDSDNDMITVRRVQGTIYLSLLIFLGHGDFPPLLTHMLSEIHSDHFR
jgi:hypothetical protein